MRYMSCSYDQLMRLPNDYVQVINDMARKDKAEADSHARFQARRRR